MRVNGNHYRKKDQLAAHYFQARVFGVPPLERLKLEHMSAREIFAYNEKQFDGMPKGEKMKLVNAIKGKPEGLWILRPFQLLRKAWRKIKNAPRVNA